MDEITIRPGEPGDVERAVDVENAVWAPFHYEAEGSPQWEYDPQLWVVAEHRAQIVASADACRVLWTGDPARLPQSWDAVIRDAPRAAGSRWSSALGTSILPEYRGGGLGERMLRALGERAADAGCLGMLAPARAPHRARYPHLDLESYVDLRLADGRHVDPWIRAHEACGARIIGWEPDSMRVSAPRAQWEEWAGARLPPRGRCLIPGSIGWLVMDGEMGHLSEESIWMLHPLQDELSRICARSAPDEILARRSLLARWSRSGER